MNLFKICSVSNAIAYGESICLLFNLAMNDSIVTLISELDEEDDDNAVEGAIEIDLCLFDIFQYD